MTLIIAFARPDVALVAADTRLSVSEWTPGAETFSWCPLRDGFHKLAATPQGFLSTPEAVWPAAGWPALGTAEIVQAWAAHMAQLEASVRPDCPAAADLTRKMVLFLVQAERDGTLACRTFDAFGHPNDLDGRWQGLVQCMPPPGFEDRCRAITRDITETLDFVRGFPASAQRVIAVQVTAQAFRTIRREAGPEGPISADVEIGLLWREAGQIERRYLHGTTDELCALTDTEALEHLTCLAAPVPERVYVRPGIVTSGNQIATASIADGQVAQAKLVTPALLAADTAGKEALDDLFVLATKTVKVGTVVSPSSITKTLRIPYGELIPKDDTIQWLIPTSHTHIEPRAIDTAARLYAAIVLPAGVTLVAFRFRGYRQTSTDFSQITFLRLENDASTQIGGLAHATTGWATVSGSLTELVSAGRSYVIQVYVQGVVAAADGRFAWFEVDYTMPSYDKGY